MDSDFFWHSLGGGAVVAAALTIARLVLEYRLRGSDRRLEHEQRRQSHQRDAEARLERILQDRLADADRRLERYEQDLSLERVRAATLEHEYARLHQAHELLKDQHVSLQAEHLRLVREARRWRSTSSAAPAPAPAPAPTPLPVPPSAPFLP